MELSPLGWKLLETPWPGLSNRLDPAFARPSPFSINGAANALPSPVVHAMQQGNDQPENSTVTNTVKGGQKGSKNHKVLIGDILEADEESPSFDDEALKFSGDDFWKKVKNVGRRIPFMEDVIAAYYCAMDTRTPNKVRAILLAALGYFVLPLDGIPDFLIGFGFTDDIAVLMAALGAVRRHINDTHYQAARNVLREEGQKKESEEG